MGPEHIAVTAGRRPNPPSPRAVPREAARHVEAVVCALDILDCFEDHDLLSAGEIALLTGANRTRVMRLAGTLESRGYLVYDTSTKRYRLGPRFLTLGKRFESGLDLINLAQPVLRSLAQQTGETASLFGIDGVSRVVLALEPGHHEVRHALAVGDRKVLCAGASGKVLLAFCPPGLVAKAMLQAGRQSDGRGLTRNELQAQLADVRRRGFAASSGERVPDAAAIAAPVFDASGAIIGALGISGASTRFTPAFGQSAVPQVVGLAEELSHQMGWRGATGGGAQHAATKGPRNERKEQASHE